MMNNIWSENKYLNLVINILLFLVGINFLHYGQLILPVICFLLFIDNRLQFKVNNPMTFVILSLFAISFYAFSYKLGFYSVMGFTLPMAYYIGSNIKNPTEANIRKVIYLLAISMGFHVILNAIIEYILHGHRGFFKSTTHYDFWTRQKISNTSTAINGDLLIGCIYYVLFHEKNKKIKYFMIITFVLSMFYLTVIGRRTPVLMIAFACIFSFLYEVFCSKTASERLRKNFIRLVIAGVIFVASIIIIYSFNLFNSREILNGYHIVRKFSSGFINDQRFELYFGSFPLMPKYPFGGQQISTILGEQVHDFWIDIYDYAGIVPCMIMLIYSYLYAKDIRRFYRDKKTSNDIKILMVGVFTCIIMQMFLEPVMTGASLFLIVAIIIGAVLEKMIINE